MTKKQLLELQEKIDKEREKLSELKAQKSVLLKYAKIEFDCSSIEELEDHKKDLAKKLKSQRAKHDKILALIEEIIEE